MLPGGKKLAHPPAWNKPRHSQVTQNPLAMLERLLLLKTSLLPNTTVLIKSGLLERASPVTRKCRHFLSNLPLRWKNFPSLHITALTPSCDGKQGPSSSPSSSGDEAPYPASQFLAEPRSTCGHGSPSLHHLSCRRLSSPGTQLAVQSQGCPLGNQSQHGCFLQVPDTFQGLGSQPLVPTGVGAALLSGSLWWQLDHPHSHHWSSESPARQ